MSAYNENLVAVLEKIKVAESRSSDGQKVRLVAVSKTKPPSDIQQCYAQGQRHFGENYVQELIDKARQLPDDIAWHFIGHLQTNKCRHLLQGVKNLAMIETVHSQKLAHELHRVLFAGKTSVQLPLPVLIQVNTSDEGSKSGLPPHEAPQLAQYIVASCPTLRIAGLMTIGLPDAPEDQPDFCSLRRCRDAVAQAIDVPSLSLELSMGMSADFEQAIAFGSTNVRVGSTIFGGRVYH